MRRTYCPYPVLTTTDDVVKKRHNVLCNVTVTVGMVKATKVTHILRISNTRALDLNDKENQEGNKEM